MDRMCMHVDYMHFWKVSMNHTRNEVHYIKPAVHFHHTAKIRPGHVKAASLSNLGFTF